MKTHQSDMILNHLLLNSFFFTSINRKIMRKALLCPSTFGNAFCFIDGFAAVNFGAEFYR